MKGKPKCRKVNRKGQNIKTYTIPQKMSGTGSIHDIASDQTDRKIEFRSGCKYAVVLASYYGGKGYTTHKSARTAVQKSRENAAYSHRVIDSDGQSYDVHGDRLALHWRE